MTESISESLKPEKTLTLLLLATILLSLLILVPTLFRYTELTKRYENQALELENVKSTMLQLEKQAKEMNKTLSILSNSPSMRAAEIIIERVGLEYFNEYYHDPVIEYNPRLNDTIIVTFTYDTEIGDYFEEHKVFFSLGENLTHYYGLPVEENLQPFNVTMDDAKTLAIQGGLPVSESPLEARIIYEWIEDVYPAKGFGEKYLWYIESWNDPPWANPRTRHSAKVDPITGYIYSVNRGGSSTHEYEVDTPEKAQAFGIDGYIKLHYSELPERILLAGGEKLNFTIQATLISYSDDLKEAILHADPEYNVTYEIQSNFKDKLKTYLTYDPNGVFILPAGESMNIKCVLSVPSSEIELSFSRYYLHTIGIEAENMLVVHDLGT